MSESNKQERFGRKHEVGCGCCSGLRPSRRGFMGMSAAAGAGAATGLFPHSAAAETAGGDPILELMMASQNDPSRRVLLKGGVVLSLDPSVGDFAQGDVLIEGTKISAVGPNINAEADVVIDASRTIVMPGFVNTHHHQYQTLLRNILADGTLGFFDGHETNYITQIQGIFTPNYTPGDAYLAELVASLSQLNAGTTTTVDTSQVSLSPEHTDACIAGLRDGGSRVLFGYSNGVGDRSRFPQDLLRIQEQYFSSADQLMTLALNTGVDPEHWAMAREAGVPIVSHIVGMRSNLQEAGRAGIMGPDNEYIHCTGLDETTWNMIADTGGTVSIAPAIEMQMGHGMPPFQEAIDRGIPISLSSDVECSMASDMFTVMRSGFTVQRAVANQRAIDGEANVPSLLSPRETLEMATMGGARTAHLDHKIGSLTPGKEADIIMLATDRINLFPLNNAPGAVVTMTDTSNVENVFVAGRPVKWQGKLLNVDVAQLQNRIEAARDALLARSNYPLNLFGSCC